MGNDSTTYTRNRARQRLGARLGAYRGAAGTDRSGIRTRFRCRLLDGGDGRRCICCRTYRAAGSLGAIAGLETRRRARRRRLARRPDQRRPSAQSVSGAVCPVPVFRAVRAVRGGCHRYRHRTGGLAPRRQSVGCRSSFLHRARFVQARVARRPLPDRRQRGEPDTCFTLSRHGSGGRDRRRSWHS